MIVPYDPLEVIDCSSKREGKRWIVRDEEDAGAFRLVEYYDRRLTCYCEQGLNRAEYPDSEPECLHLQAVIRFTLPPPRPYHERSQIPTASFVD